MNDLLFLVVFSRNFHQNVELMHQSFVTMAPRPRGEGNSWANVAYFNIVPTVRGGEGEFQGFDIPWQTWQ